MEKIPNIDYTVAVASDGMLSKENLGYPESPEISEVERLLNEFEAHESSERKFVQHYREVTEKTENPLVRFLLRLIVADEEKHHAVTHAMAATLKADLNWTRPADAISGIADLNEANGELLKVTEDFIKLEKEGMRDYKKLIKASEGYYGGLFAMLLNSMIHDSEKHIEILEFLRRRLKDR